MGWSKACVWLGLGVCACSDRVVASDDGDGEGTGAAVDDADDGSEGEAEEISDGGGGVEVDEGAPIEERQALLAVATFLDPQRPLQWHMVSEWEGDELVEVTLQSLSLDIGSTTSPRLLVGDPFVVETATGDTGEIAIAIEELFVPGVANPITGTEVVGEGVRMQGFVQLDGTACGVVMGMITAPIETSLGGSTFAITPIVALDALPDVVVAGC